MYQRHATHITYFYCFPGLTRSPEDSLRSGPGPTRAEHLQKRLRLPSRAQPGPGPPGTCAASRGGHTGACTGAAWEAAAAAGSQARGPPAAAPHGPRVRGPGPAGVRGLWERSVLPSVLEAATSGPRTALRLQGCRTRSPFCMTGRALLRLARRAMRSRESPNMSAGQ